MQRVVLLALFVASVAHMSSAIKCHTCQAYDFGAGVNKDPSCKVKTCDDDDMQTCVGMNATITVSGVEAKLYIRDCINAIGCAFIESDPSIIESIMSQSAPNDAKISDIEFRCCDSDKCNSQNVDRR